MPRHLSRDVAKKIKSRALGCFEVMRISKSVPFTVWDYRFAITDRTVEFAGNIYRPLDIKRGDSEINTNYSFDRVSMSVDNTNLFWSKLIGQAVLSGVRVQILKVFMGSLANERDAIIIFDGFLGSPSFSTNAFSFEVRSIIAYHDTEIPQRNHQSNCPVFLGSEACGVDMTDYVNTRSIVAENGSSKWRINAPSYIGDLGVHHWDGGYVVAMSGPYTSIVRPINWSDSLGRVHLKVPFDNDITGASFVIRRSCDKTKKRCDIAFSNLTKYQGFSEVPKEPASIGQVPQS